MKKISIFIATIFIALIGVFGNFNFKNAAEPNYFIQNKQNAANFNQNTITIYLEYVAPTVETEIENTNIIKFLQNSETKVYTTDNNIITLQNTENTFLSFSAMYLPSYNTYYATFEYSNNTIEEYTPIAIANAPNIPEEAKNKWQYTYPDKTNYVFINKLEFTNVELNNITLEELNNLITPYTGNQTEEPNTKPISSLDQIGAIITDTISWFTNIFSGLADAFYTNGQLTVWGTVLFIGVAITLVMFGLKWVISLIKGI